MASEIKIKLSRLIKDLNEVNTIIKGNPTVVKICDDTRNVVKNSLFVAIKGQHIDGHDLIDEAINSGAVAIIGQRNYSISWNHKNVTYIQVKNSRRALSKIVNAWYDFPSKKLINIGITGTDGKTTTSNILFHLLQEAGYRTGLVSTVKTQIDEKLYETGLHVSNPEPLVLYKFLNEMVLNKCKYAVLEVTSHGLDQERVFDIMFDISVLTNITREHIDYHKTLSRYIDAKMKLINNSKTAIISVETFNEHKLALRITKNVEIIRASEGNLEKSILIAIKRRFPEKYNQQNGILACLAALKLGVSSKQLVQGVKSFRGVEGRLEEIKNKLGIRIIVDFAHTPAAVDNVLREVKKNTKGKLIAIVSAEGERDPDKRPKISKIACNYADFTILNPIDCRSEDSEKILNQMISGAMQSKAKQINYPYIIDKLNNKETWFTGIIDRKKAIELAITKFATVNDTVIICGKGHEKSMAIGNSEIFWSDKEVIKNILVS